MIAVLLKLAEKTLSIYADSTLPDPRQLQALAIDANPQLAAPHFALLSGGFVFSTRASSTALGMPVWKS
jgi:hypothetical protein